ncbi:hypothetical protein GHT06_019093 [Daphnia sinensis]|uniref:ZP domain-containing protein n=1 Tax=Daphnia sinensis TaxID=1820382 RepID=A0AAD5KK89_9CRUS|nr:hypothetical protein GHT06_019093 [Daphnia sinensis]
MIFFFIPVFFFATLAENEQLPDIRTEVLANGLPVDQNNRTKIGDNLTFVFHVHEHSTDMFIKNCFASNGLTNRIQLIDSYGCPLRPKLMRAFKRVGNALHATMTAFRIAETSTLSLTCEVELCREMYVALGSNRSKYSFVIPANGCGTALADGTQSNILIFQSDPIVQEIWDVSRKVSCRFSEKISKYVTWSPLTVEMLDVQSSGKTGEVDCWMDVMKGVYPATKPIDGNLKIGEELSLIIYLRDVYGLYDMAVRDCWAYDDGNIDVESTLKLQLTSTDGCSKKPKLMHFWRRTDQVGDSNATLVTYSNITAFRFPTKSEVFFTCNIDICEGSFVCFPGSNDARCPTTTSRPPVVSTLPPLPPPPFTTTGCYPGSPAPGCVTTPTRAPCFPGSNEPGCPTTTSVPNFSSPSPPSCFPGSSDPRCPSVIPLRTTTPRPPCIPGLKVPGCSVTTSAPLPSTITTTEVPSVPSCFPGSKNPECPTITSTSPAPTPYTPDCSPGTNNPKCPPPVTIITSPAPPVCLPGSKDPRCPTTTQPPCFPGSDDPRCPPVTRTTTTSPAPPILPILSTTTTIKPFLPCVPGSDDPRCPTVRTTTPSPSCFPGSSDPKCPTVATTTVSTATTETYRCIPGSNDPNCPQPTTFTTTTTLPPIVCTPESNDPRCPTVTVPTVPSQVCFPGSKDPRCPQPPPVCTPGSEDPRCPPVAPSTTSTTSTTTTASPPICTPGSTDPRCPTTTTILQTTSTTTQQPPSVCTPESKDPRCSTLPPRTTTTTTTTPNVVTTTTQRQPICTPGSNNPGCPTPSTTTQSPPRCIPGSNDLSCPPTVATTETPSKCIPGSNDPRCLATAETSPPPFRCNPESKDPRCLPTTTSTTQRPPICVPGSTDPRCPTTPSPPICVPNSNDPRCPATLTTARPRSTTQTVTEISVASKTRKPSTAASVDEPGKPGWEGADPRYHAFHSCKFTKCQKLFYVIELQYFLLRVKISKENMVDKLTTLQESNEQQSQTSLLPVCGTETGFKLVC